MIRIETRNASGLLSSIKKAIDDKKITTWTYEYRGSKLYFTHTSPQWTKLAWFDSDADNCIKLLRFDINREYFDTTERISGFYHGQFIEMLLSHFSRDFYDLKVFSWFMESRPPDPSRY